jgi:hypothetical protein
VSKVKKRRVNLGKILAAASGVLASLTSALLAVNIWHW